MPTSDLAQYVKNLAADVGFDLCGVARAEPIKRAAYVREWLNTGQSGSMDYLHNHLKARLDPSIYVSGAKTVVMVALLYHQALPRIENQDPGGTGRVAMYAWGQDYHKIVRAKLLAMVRKMRTDLAETFEVRACVDTAPLLERELAAAAGIGWIGRNTMVVSRGLGSYLVLGALVTTLELAPDEPMPDRCGTCTACLEACPTKALTAPYRMDASRCISYLTIEHRGKIEQRLRALMGDWVFGCDVCQQVCPYNRHAPLTTEPRFEIRRFGPRPRLDDMLCWSEEDYRAQVRGSAVKRASLEMLQRNAQIALANNRAS